MTNYGQLIKAAREKAELTQEQLGNAIGVTGVTIMRYEKGQRQPKMNTIAQIAIALNCPVQNLLSEDEPDEFGWSINEKIIDAQDSIRENELLLAFYGLNYEGQNKVIRYAEDLNKVPEYQIEREETPQSEFSPLGEKDTAKIKKPPASPTKPTDGE